MKTLFLLLLMAFFLYLWRNELPLIEFIEDVKKVKIEATEKKKRERKW